MSLQNAVAHNLVIISYMLLIIWSGGNNQSLEEVISRLNEILDLLLEILNWDWPMRYWGIMSHFQESFQIQVSFHEPVPNENRILDTVISRSEELFSRVSKYMNDYPNATESWAYEGFPENKITVSRVIWFLYELWCLCWCSHRYTSFRSCKGLGLIIKSILLEMLDKKNFFKAYPIVAKYTHAHFLTNIKMLLNQSDIITSSPAWLGI